MQHDPAYAQHVGRQPTWKWPTLRRIEITASVVTAAVSVLSLFTEPLDRSIGVTRKPDLLGVVLLLAGTLPLAVADRYPRTVTVATFTGVLVAGAIGYATGPAPVAPLIALGLAAFLLDRPTAVALGLAATAGIIAAELVSPALLSAGLIISNVAVVLLVTLLGVGIRVQREYAAALESRTRELEQLRDIETREAIAQERLRIARDLHDIVGHALAAITLHAQVARRRLSGAPQLVAEPLDEIIELSTDALAQTRETVGLMRGGTDSAELTPPPTLDDLDDLITGLRTADARIELVIGDGAVDVPVQVQCAGYRIAQEALSNFIKHARAATAVVTVHRTPEALTVEVRDNGATAHGPVRIGSGIRGMRERAAALGGTLDAGPRREHGWEVKATLPIARARQ
jgi:signal transduction histidine kinase